MRGTETVHEPARDAEYFYRAMLSAERGIATASGLSVCLSVCPSVCPSVRDVEVS